MTTLLVLAGTIGLPFAIFDVAGQSNSESSGSAIAASGSYRRAALALSGGGFRAMTGDMALARALARIGAWESVTHVSSVSGGTWFSSLFFYVPAFHEKVVGNDPLREVVAAMSDDYSAALERALTTGGFRTLASRDMTAHSACSYIFARAMDALMNVNIFVFPATDWFAYVSLAVLPNLPPERTYTAQRTTPVLEDITLIHNTAVTKTAWVGSGDNRKLVELVVEVGAPRETAVGSWVAAPFEHVATLPLYYVSSRRNATYREGWLLPPAFSSNLSVRAYGSGEPLKPSDSTEPGWKLVLTHCECHPWGVPGRLKPLLRSPRANHDSSEAASNTSYSPHSTSRCCFCAAAGPCGHARHRRQLGSRGRVRLSRCGTRSHAAIYYAVAAAAGLRAPELGWDGCARAQRCG